MLRLGSDQCPAYTHKQWKYFYSSKEVRDELASSWAKVGELARAQNVRLSFHPGQFCVLASDKPHVVESSLSELEYHADLVEWMGFGKAFQDFKINVHLSGTNGGDGFRSAYGKMSDRLKKSVTLENDEYVSSIDDVLKLSDLVPAVLDIHHHWINSGGEYFSVDDKRWDHIKDSWRGVRPVIHYSVSREDCLTTQDIDVLPNLTDLLNLGYKKAKLRAHSEYMWNNACNKWAETFCNDSDIMVESKMKNLSSIALYNQIK